MGKHQVRSRNKKVLRLFGYRLRALRLAKGMTQEQLSEAAKVSVTTVSTLESGKLNTSIATCADLAKALGVDLMELFDFRKLSV